MNFIYYDLSYQPIIYYYFPYVQPTISVQEIENKHQQPPQNLLQQSFAQEQKEQVIQLTSIVSRTPKKIKRSQKKKPKFKSNRKRDSNFSGKSQKQNRNYTSIVCRLFLHYLTNHPTLQRLFAAMKQQYRIMLTVQNFRRIFGQIFDLKKNYIRKQLIQSVCTSQICDQQFSLIFRVLFRQFLKLQIFPTVFKSNKLSKKVKSKEVKFAKKVYETFFQTKRQQKMEKNIPIHILKKN